MEYSLGFFGGAGMAYGTFTSSWESTDTGQKKSSNLIPILLVVLFIPFVVWQQSFTIERLQKNYESLVGSNAELAAWIVQIFALMLILGQTIFVLVKYHFTNKTDLVQFSKADVNILLGTHFAIYTIFSLLITGAFVSTYRIEQYLYLVNYAVILVAIPKLSPVFYPKPIDNNKWARNFLLVMVILAALALLAISSHGELPCAHKRFEF